MRTIWRNLRYGLRGVRKQPGFSGLAVLALALGIGAATTIFSVIQNVLLDPFPYTNAERVVTFYIHDVNQSGIGPWTAMSRPPMKARSSRISRASVTPSRASA